MHPVRRWYFAGPLRVDIAVALFVSALIAACAAPGAGSPAPSVGSTEESAAATDAESSQAPEPVAVTMAATGAYYALAPAFVAANNGYFADEGIDIDLQIIQPGAAAAAMSSGDVDFIVSASTDVVNLAAQGIDVLAVAGFERYLVLDVTVSEEIAEANGLTADMPIEEKFLALEGMTVGTTGPGTSTQVFLDWMLEEAGLDPLRDVTAITAPTHGELRALLEGGQIDAFIAGPPASITAENDGVAVVFIRSSLGEIPHFGSDFIYEVNFTLKDFATQNAEIVERVNRALLRGVEFVADEEAGAVIEAMGEPYAQADPDMLAQTMDEGRAGFDREGLMTEEQWERAVEFFALSGQDVSAVDTAEGGFWTNEYLR